MIDALLKLPYSAVISIVQMLSGRPRLKLECWWCHQPNEDGVGNYIAFWIKIINPGKDSLYLERIEAKDSKGEIFFPLVFMAESGQEIAPRQNIVALIPCGHITNTMPREITVVDATETHYRLKGKKLSKAVASLVEEVNRLQALGHSIHPNRRWRDIA